MTPLSIKQPTPPWYTEPWPWLLMSGPALVIVAGVITTTMAFRSSDGLVADDYYKQGLMINKALARDQQAASRHLAASGQYVPSSVPGTPGRLRLVLRGDSAAPAVLNLRLVHPTRSGQDRAVLLKLTQPGVYEGDLDVPVGNHSAGGRWLVALEQGDWRLTGEWIPGSALTLSSSVAGGVANGRS